MNLASHAKMSTVWTTGVFLRTKYSFETLSLYLLWLFHIVLSEDCHLKRLVNAYLYYSLKFTILAYSSDFYHP